MKTRKPLPQVRCPAGAATEAGGKIGVYCKIERCFLSFRENPKSVAGYCSSDYDRCPTWIADAERDPAVLRAHGTPPMTRCPECGGSGIERTEVLRSGLWLPHERPCDACRGGGQVAA